MSDLTVAHSDVCNETYSVGDIQAILGVSRSTVYGILRANLFPYSMTDGQPEVAKEGFDKWFRALAQDMAECHRAQNPSFGT